MEFEWKGYEDRERIKRELIKEEGVISYVNCYKEVKLIYFIKIIKGWY